MKEKKIMFRPSFPGQKDVFLPDVEVCFQQKAMNRKELAELLELNIPQEVWDRAKQVFDEIYEDCSEERT